MIIGLTKVPYSLIFPSTQVFAIITSGSQEGQS